MRIKIERSGGFSGIPLSKEMDTKDFPSELISMAKKIVSNQSKVRLRGKVIPKRHADQFIYRISIDDGQEHKVIECTESDIIDDLKILIKFVEKSK